MPCAEKVPLLRMSVVSKPVALAWNDTCPVTVTSRSIASVPDCAPNAIRNFFGMAAPPTLEASSRQEVGASKATLGSCPS